MAFPQVRAVGAADANTGAIAPGLPAGTVAGDILVLFIESDDVEIAVESPAGWIAAGSSPQIEGSVDGDDTRLTVFWKRAGASEIAPLTSETGDHQIGRIIGVSGCVGSGSPFDVTVGGVDSASSTAVAVPGVTTTAAETLVLAACATGYSADSTSELSGWSNSLLVSVTERIDNATDQGHGGGIGVATGALALASDYGTTTATLARAARKALWSGALTPLTVPAVMVAAAASLGGLAASAIAAAAPSVTAMAAADIGGLSASPTARVSHPAVASGDCGGVAAGAATQVAHTAAAVADCGGLDATAGVVPTLHIHANADLGGIFASVDPGVIVAFTLGAQSALSAAAPASTSFVAALAAWPEASVQLQR